MNFFSCTNDDGGIRKIFFYPFIPLYNVELNEHYKDYLSNIADVFAGGQKIEYGHTIETPDLNFASLIAQMYTIQMELCKSDTTKKAYTDYLNIYEALSRVQVFLVTSDNENLNHDVTSLFDGETKSVYVPKGESFGDGDSDNCKLGCYTANTGTIYLWVDRISRYAHNKLIFQEVLLHEIIHMLFDVIRKSSHRSKDGKNEERMDNFLVMHCYAHAKFPSAEVKGFIFDRISNFIENQPLIYHAGELYKNNQSWCLAKRELFKFLKQIKTDNK